MKKLILKTKVSHGSLESYVPQILSLAKTHTSSYACFMNVHMAIEAVDNPDFKEVVNEADFAFPDGVPIAKLLQFKYSVSQDRIAGMDMLPYLLRLSNLHHLNVGFIGSTEEVLDIITEKVTQEHPNVSVTAAISPPFGKLWDNEAYAQLFNSTNTHFIFVAFGCPKQEVWMHSQKGLINALMFGVGGAFPVYANLVQRAPKWMQRYGLEWVYRLSQEPQRLFKRYFYTNSKFLLLSIKDIISGKRESE